MPVLDDHDLRGRAGLTFIRPDHQEAAVGCHVVRRRLGELTVRAFEQKHWCTELEGCVSAHFDSHEPRPFEVEQLPATSRPDRFDTTIRRHAYRSSGSSIRLNPDLLASGLV